jgi:transcriptional regulator with XRE-family HTH domain
MKAKNLTEYLAQSRLTQRALARALGISPSHLCDMLAGRRQPSLTVAVRIEQMTGVPIAALVRKAA